MAITKVQQATGNGATLVLNGVAVGNALFLQDSYYRGTSTGAGEATPTDSNGTFSVARADAPQVLSSQDIGVGLFYEENVASGTHTVTPQANTAHNTTLVEFSGLATSGSLDATVTSGKGSGTGTSQSTGTTPATVQADELSLVAFCMGDTGVGSTNVGLTDPITNYTTLQLVQDDQADLATQHAYRVLAATGTQAVTFAWTNSHATQFWEAAIATFKGAASSGTGGPLGPFHSDPGMGPQLRRRRPQLYPDTYPTITDLGIITSRAGRLRPGGPKMRTRLAQRFPDQVLNAYTLPSAVGTFVLTGIAANLQHNDDLVANTGTFTLAGIAANTLKGYVVSAAQGAFTLTGIAAGSLRTYVATAVKGTFVLTGNVINLLVGRVVSATTGSFVETGVAATLRVGHVLSGSVGAFSVAGNAANLVYSGAGGGGGPTSMTQNPLIGSPPRINRR